jgi:hypothetical protein
MIRVRYAKAPPPVSRSRAAMASRRCHSLADHRAEASCEDVDAAGDFDEFGHPSNSGDQRIVTFLEEYPWSLR